MSLLLFIAMQIFLVLVPLSPLGPKWHGATSDKKERKEEGYVLNGFWGRCFVAL